MIRGATATGKMKKNRVVILTADCKSVGMLCGVVAKGFDSLTTHLERLWTPH